MYIIIGIIIFFSLLIFLDKKIIKKTKFGFYIVMGEFGAGKTQNTTAYLKKYKYGKEINITNYYTGYTHFQISSHEDLVNILNDIYDYHLYINLYDDRHKLYKFKQDKLKLYETKAEAFRLKYPGLKKGLKFNIVLDESSILFNPRNFAKNFSGENERLLDFIYQPRKLNILFFTVVQSPMELDVKFRRLASYYRKYYKGLIFWRWYRDFYFLDPEEIDLEKAEQVGGGVIMGMNINLYPIYPYYDYNTKELIRPGEHIYKKGSIYDYMDFITKNPKKPDNEYIPLWNFSQHFIIYMFLIFSSFIDFLTTYIGVYRYGTIEVNPLYQYILSFDSLILFYGFRVFLVPTLFFISFYFFKKLSNFYLIPVIVFTFFSIFNLINILNA